MPIPNDDKLNPVVYKVKGTPDGIEFENKGRVLDAEADEDLEDVKSEGIIARILEFLGWKLWAFYEWDGVILNNHEWYV